jgi:hypothetical protein
MFRFLFFDCWDDCIRDAAFCFCQLSSRRASNFSRKARGRGGEGLHTSTSELHTLLRPFGRLLNVLTSARQLRAILVIVHHVSCAAATGCEEVLFDGGGDQVSGCGCFADGVDVSFEVRDMSVNCIVRLARKRR